MDLAPVRLETGEDGVALLTLSRGTEGNRLNRAAIDALVAAIEATEADRAVRVLVLRAEGKSFCLGLDLDAFLDPRARPDPDGLAKFQEAMLRLYRHRAPVIAVVEGRTEGGGLGLVAACDLVIAGEGARFMLPEVILGMIPCMILPFLSRRLTPGTLRALGLSSRTLDGAEGRAIGLVDEYAETDAPAALERHLKRLLRSAPNSLTEVKRLTERFAAGDLDRDIQESFTHLLDWLGRSEVTRGAHLFAQGFSPPWFARRSHTHDD